MPEQDESCARCGGSATFSLKENGEVVLLCSICLDREFPSLSLGSLRKHFHRPRASDGRCPNCGWTTDQMKKTSLVGCPLCYEALDIAALNG